MKWVLIWVFTGNYGVGTGSADFKNISRCEKARTEIINMNQKEKSIIYVQAKCIKK